MTTKTMWIDGITVADVLEKIGDYWKQVTGAVAAVGAVWLYIKKGHAFVKGFAGMPAAIEDIKTELQFENGMSLRRWVLQVDQDMTGLRQAIAFQTVSRRSLLDAVDVPMFECKINGEFQWVNHAYMTMADCEMEGLLGHNWRNSIAGPDRDEVIDGWALAVRDGTDFKSKFRLATDQTENWVRLHIICNKDDMGQTLGFTGKLWRIEDPRQAGIHTTSD